MTIYLRCRDDLRQELRRYRQRLQQCLIRHGHVYRGGCNWTQSYWRWLGELGSNIPYVWGRGGGVQ